MLAHLGIAFLTQSVIGRLLRNWWAGAAVAAAWAISREITQAEYRWIEAYGSGLRANMPWWGGLSPKVWHLDAMIDWLAPSAATIGIAFLVERRRKVSQG